MPRYDQKVLFLGRVALVALAALGLGACSRSQHVMNPVSGPGRAGVNPQVVTGCPSLNGNTLNNADAFTLETGNVAQFRTGRLRIETVGDMAVPTIQSMGGCVAADIPTINIISGHANVFLNGTTTSVTTSGNRLTFGSLVPLGVNVEPGIALGSDAQGNILEVIWPDLAGIGTGSPHVRVQLAAWNLALVTASTKLDVTWDLTFEQDGVQQSVKGHCEGMPMDGTAVVGLGSSLAPCPATLGSGGAVVNPSGVVKQFRSKRLRLELNGDVASGALQAAGPCAASDAATIQFTGGSGDVTRAGTNNSVTSTGKALTFGALAFPGLLVEPGVLIASDNNRNVLEIIWPALAGLPPGPPVLRFQLTKWNSWIQTGRAVDVSLRFNVIGPDGNPATFTAAAQNIAIPVQK